MDNGKRKLGQVPLFVPDLRLCVTQTDFMEHVVTLSIAPERNDSSRLPCTSRPLVPPGLTQSNTVYEDRARPSRTRHLHILSGTWLARVVDTSFVTAKHQSRFGGLIANPAPRIGSNFGEYGPLEGCHTKQWKADASRLS